VVERSQRHTRNNRCPICGGADEDPRGKERRCHGFTSTDGDWAHCSREDLAGPLEPEAAGTYAHLMRGPCKCGQTHGERASSEPEAIYDYRDETGALLFQVIRFPGKKIRNRGPDGTWKLNGARRVLYRLPELLAADPAATVYVVEGEKDADTLRRHGLVATTNPHGAGKWQMVRIDAENILRNRKAIVCADNDPEGIRHARTVAASLGAPILIAPAPHKDVSDLYAVGGTIEQMLPLDEREAPQPAGHTDEDLSDESPRCTDSANADAFVTRYGQDFRYVIDWDAWIAWTGQRWDITGASHSLMRAIKRSVREDYAETHAKVTELAEEHRKALLKDEKDNAEKIESKLKYHRTLLQWHEQSQNSAKLEACAKILRSDLVIRMAALDANPWLFNVRNGTLDLRTATLSAHSRTDYISQLSDIPWEDQAKCPTWDAFLATITGARPLLGLYLGRLVGYALTGVVDDHVLVFHYGAGSNGKSTFLRTIQALMGDYGCAAPRNLLFDPGNNPPHPSEIARLYGKRLAICNEVPDGKAFDEAKLKDLTGGDVVACRRMNENWWDLHPTHKLHLAGNHKPVVKGDDLGLWRRIKLVPWEVTIGPEAMDPKLPEKLRAELPGILVRAVHGCLEWQRIGLVEPATVSEATSEYRRESDVFGEWLESNCVLEPSARITRADLRQNYEQWCKEQGHPPLGARALARRLADVKVTGGPVRSGARVKNGWRGIRAKTVLEESEEMPS
jgi:putative DNA primase/helicase